MIRESDIIAVGEQWLSGECRFAKWNAEIAMRFGAFKSGPSSRFLQEFRFAASKTCNLLPPSPEWDERLAFQVAEQLISRKDWKVAAVFGARAVKAFLGRSFTWGDRFPVGADKIVVPIPQVSNPIWRSHPGLKSKVEMAVLSEC